MEDTLESRLNSFIDFKFSALNTCMLCTVENVRDLGEQRIDVKPLVNKQFVDSDVLEYPAILSVPLVFPSSSTSAITFPVNKGDVVVVIFSQSSIDVFKSGSHTAHDPVDTRRFDRRDAIAIPCAFAFDKAINKQSNRTLPHSTTDVVIAHNINTPDECEIRLDPTGGLKITAKTINVVSNVATITCPTATFTGNLAVTGDLSVTGVSLFTGISTFNGALVSTTTTTLTGTATLNGLPISTS